MTIQNMYQQGEILLKEAQIEDAGIDAWILLEFVTGISKTSYFANMQQELSKDMENKYFHNISKRGEHIPVQHITGEQDFMGYRFKVNEHVLIPRQDTETLVEEALCIIRPNMSVLDMCTGSGCILLSLMKYASERCDTQGIQGKGLDISQKALEVAKENASNLSIAARFVQSDLFQSIKGTTEKYDLIVSNPPYIRTTVIEQLQTEVKCHDPYIALDGKEDGLYFYRKIISESVFFMQKGGHLIFEIGFDQSSDVVGLMERAGYENICVKKDLTGLDRVVSGRYNRL